MALTAHTRMASFDADELFRQADEAGARRARWARWRVRGRRRERGRVHRATITGGCHRRHPRVLGPRCPHVVLDRENNWVSASPVALWATSTRASRTPRGRAGARARPTRRQRRHARGRLEQAEGHVRGERRGLPVGARRLGRGGGAAAHAAARVRRGGGGAARSASTRPRPSRRSRSGRARRAATAGRATRSPSWPRRPTASSTSSSSSTRPRRRRQNARRSTRACKTSTLCAAGAAPSTSTRAARAGRRSTSTRSPTCSSTPTSLCASSAPRCAADAGGGDGSKRRKASKACLSGQVRNLLAQLIVSLWRAACPTSPSTSRPPRRAPTPSAPLPRASCTRSSAACTWPTARARRARARRAGQAPARCCAPRLDRRHRQLQGQLAPGHPAPSSARWPPSPR